MCDEVSKSNITIEEANIIEKPTNHVFL